MMEFRSASAAIGSKSGFVHELRFVASDAVPLSPDYSAAFAMALEDAVIDATAAAVTAALGEAGSSLDRAGRLHEAWSLIEEQGALAV